MIRFQVAAIMIAAILLGSVVMVGADPVVDRIAGEDRYDTAARIAEHWDEADTVVLARGDNFPDALAGTPLAYQYDAPILLTPSEELDERIQTEIENLQADNAIILGGEAAVSESVKAEVEDMGLEVERIAGSNRYETAWKIADELGDAEEAFIASGDNFPDALAVGPYAARQEVPILLTPKDNLADSTSEALEGIDSTTIVGGNAVIGEEVENQLPDPSRIAGDNRFDTAAKVVSELDMPTEEVYIATGFDFADALTGSALAARKNAPIALVRQDDIPEYTKGVVEEATTLRILGGGAVVGREVEMILRGEEPEKEAPYCFHEIVGIEPGAGITEATEEAISAYDLELELAEGSDAAMTAELSYAIAEEEWIVVTGWTPHLKFAEWDLKFLEDPKGVYGEEEYIGNIAREGLQEDLPEVYEFLENFYWGDDEIGEVIAKNAKDDTDLLGNAQEWIDENRDFVEDEWLPEDFGAEAEGQEINIAYVKWECATASLHVAQAVLEDAGYNVSVSAVDAGPMWAGLAEGYVDFISWAWLPVTHGSYWDYYGDNVEEVSTHYEGARIGLVVPEYVDIDSIEEINDYICE